MATRFYSLENNLLSHRKLGCHPVKVVNISIEFSLERNLRRELCWIHLQMIVVSIVHRVLIHFMSILLLLCGGFITVLKVDPSAAIKLFWPARLSGAVQADYGSWGRPGWLWQLYQPSRKEAKREVAADGREACGSCDSLGSLGSVQQQHGAAAAVRRVVVDGIHENFSRKKRQGITLRDPLRLGVQGLWDSRFSFFVSGRWQFPRKSCFWPASHNVKIAKKSLFFNCASSFMCNEVAMASKNLLGSLVWQRRVWPQVDPYPEDRQGRQTLWIMRVIKRSATWA